MKQKRICAYVRVSTTRQAGHETSLEQQREAIASWCAASDARLVETYVEAGASATNDKRPAFQRMVADALSADHPYDAIVVYRFSRFFRDAHFLETYRLMLLAARVDLISATQRTDETDEAHLMRSMIALMDEHSSRTNGTQTRRVMASNAEAGFWKGSIPPVGFRTYTAEVRGKKHKKKLEVEPEEAALVRRIFSMYLRGERETGPLGIKLIATRLKNEGILCRGREITNSKVATILKCEAYIGTAYWNKTNSKTRQVRPKSEWVAVDVPVIVPPADFDAVQARLATNHPKVTPPRTVNSPTLLTAKAKCGQEGCGTGMLLMTGKGGKHRYYQCQRKKKIAANACSQPNLRMGDVDDAVIAAIEEIVLEPTRLNELLSRLVARTDEAAAERKQLLEQYRVDLAERKASLDRIWTAIDSGLGDVNDPDVADRMKAHRARVAFLKKEIDLLEKQDASPAKRITPEKLSQFAQIIREKLRGPDPALRKAYVQLLIDEVIVTDRTLLIRGSKAALAHAVANPGSSVPTFAEGWRTRQDSNL